MMALFRARPPRHGPHRGTPRWGPSPARDTRLPKVEPLAAGYQSPVASRSTSCFTVGMKPFE